MTQLIFKWAMIFTSAALFIASDALSANWGKQGSLISLLLMCLLAPLGYFCFGLLNRNTSLSVSSGLVNMMLLIGTILIGIFYFHDELSSRQFIGLIFAVLAVIFMI